MNTALRSERIVVTQAGGPEVLRLEPWTVPAPGPGQLRIAVERAGVSFGDLLLQRHVFRDIPRVAVPGYDVVGRVESVGPGVSDFVPGERVAVFVEYGGYARHALVRAGDAVRIGAKVEPSSAAAVILNYSTAFALLGTQQLASGEWVVVPSATGGVGSALVDVARSRG